LYDLYLFCMRYSIIDRVCRATIYQRLCQHHTFLSTHIESNHHFSDQILLI
jgi:hypothetical protein